MQNIVRDHEGKDGENKMKGKWRNIKGELMALFADPIVLISALYDWNCLKRGKPLLVSIQ